FFQLCDKITSHLFSINNGTSTLERCIKQIGTPSDNQQLRDRISQIYSSVGTAVQESTSLLRSVHPLVRRDKQRKIRAERIQEEFQSAATRFSEIQKKMVEALRVAPLPADMVAIEQDQTATADMEEQERQLHTQKQALADMEFETAMALEKEQRVRQLEGDMLDINQIMRDLSSMVVAQGEIIGWFYVKYCFRLVFCKKESTNLHTLNQTAVARKSVS
ncbi:unnamed protein product, partial [Meganyctiphanes norvegica]